MPDTYRIQVSIRFAFETWTAIEVPAKIEDYILEFEEP